MAKNLKLNIKNAQIAEAINLSSLKSKLASKKAEPAEEPKKTPKAPKSVPSKEKVTATEAGAGKETKEEAPRIRARARSAFAEPTASVQEQKAKKPISEDEEEVSKVETTIIEEPEVKETPVKTSEELRREIFAEELEEQARPVKEEKVKIEEKIEVVEPKIEIKEPKPVKAPAPVKERVIRQEPLRMPAPHRPGAHPHSSHPSREGNAPVQKLGPTGKHIKDLLPHRYAPKPPVKEGGASQTKEAATKQPGTESEADDKNRVKIKQKGRELEDLTSIGEDSGEKKGAKSKFKEFRDIKPAKREQSKFDARDRQGLRDSDEDSHWRKKRAIKHRVIQEDVTIRPTSLKVRIPIILKDLAAEMKLKASQLIAKLFAQGVVVTLNDVLEDETTIQLLGHEFGCEITIDTTEEKRIRVTDKSIKEEITSTDPSKLEIRPPVVAFMGHVDHGKTSLIDAIRKSNRAAGEAGAITQHIGAFRCSTSVGDIAILDTPGHEAFSAMRARGAEVTDIVVLVVAGDEGMKQQTIEALQHAKAAKVTIVVAINKCDKPNFNPENVYRQLSEQELLPEAWGGQTITINCSAVTGEGISQLLEMLALQAEVLELRADPTCRARGTVLESEMHKGMGAVTTVLVQNGTLRIGDSLVFSQYWGKVKTMRDEFNRELTEAGPSYPVEITGLSGLPEAGQEFIVVKNEKEAREIAEARSLDIKQVSLLQTKKLSMENLLQQASDTNKKILNIVLRADVQGSLEAIKAALMKIESKKADLNIIFAGVGEITESDIQLAAASKAVVIGFHTQIESHAEALMKQVGVQARLHNIIYHAIDDVKDLMSGLLDKIAVETEKGKAEVKAIFKSSHYGIIAGCIVTEGSIHRNYQVRLKRDKEVVWKGPIASLKRVKEDVREVAKGLECGIVLSGWTNVLEGDSIEAYEITYITQEL